MSVVVAVRKDGQLVMAADTQSNFGGKIVPAPNGTTSKIRRVGHAVLGRAGWGVYENILNDVLAGDEPVLEDGDSVFRFFNALWRRLHKGYAFVNDQSKRRDSPFGDLGGSFLVGTGDGIHYVAPNLGVNRFTEYYAIGSGADFAMGALAQLYPRDGDAGSVAREAVATAIRFSSSCGGAIESLGLARAGGG